MGLNSWLLLGWYFGSCTDNFGGHADGDAGWDRLDLVWNILGVSSGDVADYAAGWVQSVCDSVVDREEYILCGAVCVAVLLYDCIGDCDYYYFSADCAVFATVDDCWMTEIFINREAAHEQCQS